MRRAVASAVAALLAACEGIPVQLGSPVEGPPPTGQSRELTARSCGFQLLYVIPIAINERLERAYAGIRRQAQDDYITDVRVTEEWTYAFVGTVYCTTIDAKAIRRT